MPDVASSPRGVRPSTLSAMEICPKCGEKLIERGTIRNEELMGGVVTHQMECTGCDYAIDVTKPIGYQQWDR